MASRSAINWPPCFTDPERGIAFFDGIKIETDTITDPRWDRVLPILQEEQIYVCRQMKRLLRPGMQVLDVGTGSGVFAIWAATQGCHVVALDISRRAIWMAQHNMAINNDLIERGGGRIEFILDDFLQFATKREYNQAFDVVILSPPYNPTAPGCAPALHAEAGPLGQSRFYEQIPKVPRLLKQTGICVGNQMTFDNLDGQMDAKRIVRDAFGEEWRFTSQDILDPSDESSIQTFLRQQYEPYFTDPERRPELERYIEQQQACATNFRLIYYEICRIGWRKTRLPRRLSPPFKWEDRVKLHRNIILHTADGPVLPDLSLFLTDHASITLQNDSTATEILTSWMQRTHVLDKNGHQSPPWDVAIVDTSPVSRDINRQVVRQIGRVWIAGDEAAENEWKVRRAWTEATLALHNERVAPFLHPGFMSAPGYFYDLIAYDVNARVQRSAVDEAQARQIEARVERALKLIRQEVSADSDRSSELKSSLKELNVVDHDEYRDTITAIIHQAREKGGNSQSDREDISELELESNAALCLHQLHRIARSDAERIICPKSGGNSDQQAGKFAWSVLISFSFRQRDESDKTTQDNIIQSYGGGAWIFVASRSPWKRAIEEQLKDLARLVWFLLSPHVTRTTSKTEGRMEKAKQLAAIQGHEINHFISSFSTHWTIEPDEKMRNTVEDSHPLRDLPWVVLPRPELMETARQFFTLWAQSNVASNFFGDSLPATVEDLAKFCWQSAKNMLKPFTVSKRNLRNPDSLQEVDEMFRFIDQRMWPGGPAWAVDDKLPTPDWQTNQTWWMDFTRLLMALFGNCVQHSDWRGHINVDLNYEAHELLVLEIRNERDAMANDELEELYESIANARMRLPTSPLIEDFHSSDIIMIYAGRLQARGEIILPDQTSLEPRTHLRLPLPNS